MGVVDRIREPFYRQFPRRVIGVGLTLYSQSQPLTIIGGPAKRPQCRDASMVKVPADAMYAATWRPVWTKRPWCSQNQE